MAPIIFLVIVHESFELTLVLVRYDCVCKVFQWQVLTLDKPMLLKQALAIFFTLVLVTCDCTYKFSTDTLTKPPH